MNCEDSKLTIMEYLDGELPADARRRFEEHLAGCDTCRQELAAQQRVIRSVRLLHRVPAPPDFAARMADAVARENTPRAGWHTWIVRYGTMAASILIVCCSALWMKTQHPVQQPPASDYAAKGAAPAESVPSKSARPEAAQPEPATVHPAAEKLAKAPAKAGASDMDLAMEEEAAAPQIAVAPAPPLDRTLAGKAPSTRSKTEIAQATARNAPVPAGRQKADVAPSAMTAPAAKPARIAPAAPAEQAQFDLVIEADNVDQCSNELAALLEQRHYKVIARISARHSVLLAELQPAAANEEKQAATDAAAGPPRSIIDEIAASGRFRVASRGEVAQAGGKKEIAASKPAEATPAPNANEPSAALADAAPGYGGRIAIMIVSRNAPEATAAAEAEPKAKPAAPGGAK